MVDRSLAGGSQALEAAEVPGPRLSGSEPYSGVAGTNKAVDAGGSAGAELRT